jgi:hypothetical protein
MGPSRRGNDYASCYQGEFADPRADPEVIGNPDDPLGQVTAIHT